MQYAWRPIQILSTRIALLQGSQFFGFFFVLSKTETIMPELFASFSAVCGENVPASGTLQCYLRSSITV